MRTSRSEKWGLAILASAFLAWSGIFVFRSSYIAIDGNRYFGLFDDAMISMRYAWNFAHGLGLVWNAGERVEGYSNLLMTLGMSLAARLLEKSMAVLVVQIFGIFTMLAIAYMTWRLARELDPGGPHQRFAGMLACACVLFYYPLSYWTLMGMETGLLALFTLMCVWFGIRLVKHDRISDLVGLGLFSGLAFLARNDSLVLTGIVFVYVALASSSQAENRRWLLKLSAAALFLSAFILGQTIFRYQYYGNLLPNTFTLKLTGIPLSIRLISGTHFVLGFIQQSWLLLILAGLGLAFEFRIVGAFLYSLLFGAIGYQIYAGGDPWESWRLLAPAMPAIFILAAEAAAMLVSRLRPEVAMKSAPVFIMSSLVLSSLAVADFPFLSDMSVQGPTSAAIANRVNTNTAIAVKALTQPEASLGVIWAGTLPYYADRRGVDFLGKSDRRIAGLSADISGAVSWGGMISVPGHNKYDLDYSIVQLRPTYIQAFSWGYATVKPWVMQNYRRVEYHGAAGTKTIFLDKDSPLVCWESCKDQYRIIPWPRQK